MVRDPRAWLWDIQQACQNLAAFLQGVDLDEYLANALVRARCQKIVNRQGGGLTRRFTLVQKFRVLRRQAHVGIEGCRLALDHATHPKPDTTDLLA